jgi:RNA recognition motif-containing protein
MNSKLYIGNLSTLTTEKELMELFLRAGTVSSVWLSKEQGSGRSKGFAYIEMSNTVEAQKAIEMFNGHQLDDHVLRVSMATHITGTKHK